MNGNHSAVKWDDINRRRQVRSPKAGSVLTREVIDNAGRGRVPSDVSGRGRVPSGVSGRGRVPSDVSGRGRVPSGVSARGRNNGCRYGDRCSAGDRAERRQIEEGIVVKEGRYRAVAEQERNRKRAAALRRRRRRKTARMFFLITCFAVLCMGGLGAARRISDLLQAPLPMYSQQGETEQTSNTGGDIDYVSETPEILEELLEKNEETLDYVSGYGNRKEYVGKPIDLTQDFVEGEVPLLMQWDRRWGYDVYGKEMIGLAGCGPLCLEMAYLYFTEDIEMTPREMAEFAFENGFYTESGTSWSLWTEGTALLGLKGEELPLDENRMKAELDAGGLIVCSMRPGDFTTTGHFILIRGYDEDGFYVNDPNRRSTSGKVWDFETLQYQIRNLWGLRKAF